MRDRYTITFPCLVFAVMFLLAANAWGQSRILTGVAAISPTDAWAVGYNLLSSSSTTTLAEHWDGTKWSIVSTPNPAGVGCPSFSAVAAVASNDVWAVGNYPLYAPGCTVFGNLIEHWDGNSWQIVSTPLGAGAGGYLGVAAISTNDVWAVGYHKTNGGGKPDSPLSAHWDGTRWTLFSSPVLKQSAIFTAVAATGGGQLCAVGELGFPYGLLIERWDGNSWQVVGNGNDASLTGVAFSRPTQGWAVGSNYALQPLVYQWDGTAWHPVILSLSLFANLDGIVALPTGEAFAVGGKDMGGGGNVQTLIEHWNGTEWEGMESPSPDPTYSILFGVAATSNTDVWAVGTYSAVYSLIERWDGASWRVVPSP